MTGTGGRDDDRVVVFDLGNVLIPWDRRRLFTRVIGDARELDRFLDEVLTLDENAVLDRGVPLERMTADLARRHPEHAELIAVFRERWIETLGPVIDESVDVLVELLESGRRCFALSNWGRDTFVRIRHRYVFLDWFEGMVISGFEGIVKPDPAIYHRLCGRYDLRPGQVVFIDDSEVNVATARRLGMDAIVFSTPADLRADLAARNLL